MAGTNESARDAAMIAQSTAVTRSSLKPSE
jgi:hypothetical protein